MHHSALNDSITKLINDNVNNNFEKSCLIFCGNVIADFDRNDISEGIAAFDGTLQVTPGHQ